jgi:hypothetical protein
VRAKDQYIDYKYTSYAWLVMAILFSPAYTRRSHTYLPPKSELSQKTSPALKRQLENQRAQSQFGGVATRAARRTAHGPTTQQATTNRHLQIPLSDERMSHGPMARRMSVHCLDHCPASGHWAVVALYIWAEGTGEGRSTCFCVFVLAYISHMQTDTHTANSSP